MWISIAVFVFTLFLVIRKPYNIGIGYSALIGAAVTLLLGITTIEDVVIVWGIVWNATFTFVAIIIASLIFDEAGFFEYIAIRIARVSRGSGKLLFVLIIVLGAVISAFFANDGTALVLTPIVYALLVRIGVDKGKILPFIMATGLIADTASLPLVVSNLVNIVTASYFGIPFARYSVVMMLPDAVSIVASIVFLWLFFRKSVFSHYDPDKINRENVIKDPVVFRIGAPFMIILVAGYAIGGFFGIAVAFIAVPAVAVLSVIAYASRRISVGKAFRSAPWQIVLFSLGMYIVVFGMGREGVTSALAGLIVKISSLPGPVPVLLSGFLFAAIAAIMNNMPSVMVVNLALGQSHGSGLLIYANVIANDIGPKFTTIGSLATLLWLHTLERKGVARISARYYTKVGLAVAVPVLTLTLLSLWLESPWLV